MARERKRSANGGLELRRITVHTACELRIFNRRREWVSVLGSEALAMGGYLGGARGLIFVRYRTCIGIFFFFSLEWRGRKGKTRRKEYSYRGLSLSIPRWLDGRWGDPGWSILVLAYCRDTLECTVITTYILYSVCTLYSVLRTILSMIDCHIPRIGIYTLNDTNIWAPPDYWITPHCLSSAPPGTIPR